MLSYWIDAVTSLFGFFSLKRDDPDLMERAMLLRMRVAHYFSLMSVMAFAQLREGNVQGWEPLDISFVQVLPKFPPGSNPMSFAANLENSEERRTRKAKLKNLLLSTDKVNTVCLWIIQLI